MVPLLHYHQLVSAFSIAVPSFDTTNVTENVCCGISVFEDAFGDEDDVSAHFVPGNDGYLRATES